MAQNDGTMVVTYASLDQAAGDIKAQADALNRSLEAIQAKIRSVADLWEGEARDAYNQAQAKWDQDASAIHTALTQISRAVQDAAPAYKGGDHKAAQNFM
ncbi:WXG100 family type VII secretion target [Streptomyces sp. NPDC051776]|uniref:WXG100 family type VII secretion target n=1 Tax=Streptomyces sp. NPDC051776 TaxID=3155414 RepID=UPI00341F303D